MADSKVDSRVIPTRHVDVTALARQTLRDCAGSLTLARKRLKHKLLSDRTLLNAIIDEVIEAAIEQCVSVAHRQDNQSVFEKARKSLGKAPPADVVQRAQAAAQVLLSSIVLGNGTVLRNANRPMLQAESQFHLKQASAMKVKGVFYESIAAALPNDKVLVKSVLSEEQLYAKYAAARTSVLGDMPGVDEAVGRGAHG